MIKLTCLLLLLSFSACKKSEPVASTPPPPPPQAQEAQPQEYIAGGMRMTDEEMKQTAEKFVEKSQEAQKAIEALGRE